MNKSFSFSLKYHQHDNFREQIGILLPIRIDRAARRVVLFRSFIQVCQPGSASFDRQNSGADTSEAWRIMDAYIEEGVYGFFHTHPPHVSFWSSQDIRAQNGLAKANGNKYLWHGVQAASTGPMSGLPDTGVPAMRVHGSEFVCSWMENGRVFRYNYGMIEDDLANAEITLDMPPPLQWSYGAYVIDPQA